MRWESGLTYVPFPQWGLIVLDRQSFELSVVKPDIDSLTQAVFDAKKGDVAARDTIVASLCWSAFRCPAALMNTYDLISNAWLRNARIAAEKNIRMPSSAATAPLDKSFWQAFWTVQMKSRLGVQKLLEYRINKVMSTIIGLKFQRLMSHCTR